MVCAPSISKTFFFNQMNIVSVMPSSVCTLNTKLLKRLCIVSPVLRSHEEN